MNQQKREVSLATVALLAVGLGAALVANAVADDAKAEVKTASALCPIMEGPIDPSVKTMFDDGPVYWCCPGCSAKYTKDPAKYASRVAAQRQALAKLPKVQVTCPISGKPVDKKIYTERNGTKVNFCCEKCKAKFSEAPDKFKAKLADSYSYQTTCPISGEDIDPAAFVEFTTGQKVYVCCPKCKQKLTADPGKYSKQLQSLNVHVDPKTVKTDT